MKIKIVLTAGIKRQDGSYLEELLPDKTTAIEEL